MGLSLSVGILAELAERDTEGYDYHQRQFAQLNRALLAAGLAPHNEPEPHVDALHGRARCGGMVACITCAASPPTCGPTSRCHRRARSRTCVTPCVTPMWIEPSP